MYTISESLTVALGHHQAGELERAEQIYREVLRSDPHQADALHLLGVLACQAGRYEAAVEEIRRAIALNPQAAAFHCNLGAAYKALGRMGEAVASYEEALRIRPHFVEAHCNLGAALSEQGKFPEAAASYQRALALKPDHVEAHNRLGIALQRQGRIEEAAASYKRALRLKPGHAAAYNNLGSALQLLERFDEAEAAYEQALAIKPDYVEGLANLADLYERLNRLEEAAATLARGLELDPDHVHLNVVAAKCEEREGRHQQALDRLARLRPLAESGVVDADVAKDLSFQLGRLYDRAGDSSRAFAQFTEANRLAMQGGEGHLACREKFLENVGVLAEVFDKAWVDSWSGALPPDGEEPPVFMIGFPRSGTTLLDVMLDGHPRIQTLEEKPTMLAVQKEIESLPGGYPLAMRDLKPGQIARLRATYFRAVDEFIERRPGHLVVDRFPMNAVRVGLILRVFPAARFIMVVRHPCDACLSCFMQDFKLNGAMANFYAIEEAAVLYAKVMGLWRQYVRVLPHAYHVVRYEDLVEDAAGQMRRLLRFIDVPWDDAVLNHTDRARTRGRISTPSYRQVTEPIYQRARYRWLRYAEHLEPVVETLRPYIEYFGYGSSEAPSGGHAT